MEKLKKKYYYIVIELMIRGDNMKIIGTRTLKTALGATIAMIIAELLGLRYWVSAGIITILSIQSTKRQSVAIAQKRFISTLLALGISSIVFLIFGFNPIAFGIYVIIFIPTTVRFKATDGIVVSSVLVTHLLVEKQISFFWIGNEIFLMVIGVGVALVLNLYMPSIEEKLKKDKEQIEECIRQILFEMAYGLRSHSVSINEEKQYRELEGILLKANERAYRNCNNYLFSDVKYYVHYIEMRNAQFQIMRYMRTHFKRLYMTFEQTNLVANFTENVAHAIGERVPLDKLFKDLNTLRVEFKNQPLPETREEFENRAMLYQFLNDMEHFLEIKREFKQYI